LANSRRSGERHVAALALAAAHQLGIISSDKFERLEVVDNLEASLEWLESAGAKNPPTDVEELELDCKSGVTP
jgi:hypothetical protein